MDVTIVYTGWETHYTNLSVTATRSRTCAVNDVTLLIAVMTIGRGSLMGRFYLIHVGCDEQKPHPNTTERGEISRYHNLTVRVCGIINTRWRRPSNHIRSLIKPFDKNSHEASFRSLSCTRVIRLQNVLRTNWYYLRLHLIMHRTIRLVG